ncbi:hypothetical protein KKA08_00345, partial [bacterium]|nr:hypothetical protein [bacterium]
MKEITHFRLPVNDMLQYNKLIDESKRIFLRLQYFLTLCCVRSSVGVGGDPDYGEEAMRGSGTPSAQATSTTGEIMRQNQALFLRANQSSR